MNFGALHIPSRVVVPAAMTAAVLFVGAQSYFTVDPSERAFVRLLGTPTTVVP